MFTSEPDQEGAADYLAARRRVGDGFHGDRHHLQLFGPDQFRHSSLEQLLHQSQHLVFRAARDGPGTGGSRCQRRWTGSNLPGLLYRQFRLSGEARHRVRLSAGLRPAGNSMRPDDGGNGYLVLPFGMAPGRKRVQPRHRSAREPHRLYLQYRLHSLGHNLHPNAASNGVRLFVSRRLCPLGHHLLEQPEPGGNADLHVPRRLDPFGNPVLGTADAGGRHPVLLPHGVDAGRHHLHANDQPGREPQLHLSGRLHAQWLGLSGGHDPGRRANLLVSRRLCRVGLELHPDHILCSNPRLFMPRGPDPVGDYLYGRVELCGKRGLVMPLGLGAFGHDLLATGQLPDGDHVLPVGRHGEPVSLCVPFFGVGHRLLVLDPDILSLDAHGLRHPCQRAYLLVDIANHPGAADDVV